MSGTDSITPYAVINVNGQTIASGFNGRLISVDVEDKSGVISDTVSIELRNGDPFVEIPKKGDIIEVWLGYKETGVANFGKFTTDDQIFLCFHSKSRSPARGADMRDGLKSQKSRHWDNKTIKNIMTDIANDNDLEPRINDKIGAHQYKWLGQQDKSDIHFGERLAKKHGAIFSVKDGKLTLAIKLPLHS